MRKHAFNQQTGYYLGVCEAEKDGKYLIESKPGELTLYNPDNIELRDIVTAEEAGDTQSYMGLVMHIIGALTILGGIIGFFMLYKSGSYSNAMVQQMQSTANTAAVMTFFGGLISGLLCHAIGAILGGIKVLQNKIQRLL